MDNLDEMELKLLRKMNQEKDAEITSLKEENERLVKWVDDLQSGMYINCVYCGHRYGPKDKVPCTMANALKQHIEQCPKHPMSALKKSLAAAKQENERLRGKVEAYEPIVAAVESHLQTAAIRVRWSRWSPKAVISDKDAELARLKAEDE